MKNLLMPVLLCACLVSPASAAEAFTLRSPQVVAEQSLPPEQILNGFGCEGKNIPPALSWENSPIGTKSFALTVYDPDAPTGSGWWHWVIFNIPATARAIELNAGASTNRTIAEGTLPAGAVESITDFGKPGYGGACPPVGDKAHRYIFTLYALDTPILDLSPTSMPALVGFSIHAHLLAKASFTAYYSR